MINFIILNILKLFDYFYQKKFIKYLKNKKKLSNLNLLLDVGAHKGESINLFADNFHINEIHSFEPNPVSFKNLSKNITNLRNKYRQTKMFFENLALGSESKKILIKDVVESSSSTIKELNKNSNYYKKKFFYLNNFKKKEIFKEYQVNQILLSDYIAKKKIESIDFLKIDTEGYEFEVLKGTQSAIHKIRFILFEHHYDDMIIKNYFFSDIHNLLIKNNFIQLFKSKMPFRKTFEYIYENKIFKI